MSDKPIVSKISLEDLPSSRRNSDNVDQYRSIIKSAMSDRGNAVQLAFTNDVKAANYITMFRNWILRHPDQVCNSEGQKEKIETARRNEKVFIWAASPTNGNSHA